MPRVVPVVLLLLPAAALGQSFHQPVDPFLAPEPSVTVAADFDGDGDLDLIAYAWLFGQLALHRNDGEGRFTRVAQPVALGSLQSGLQSLAAADFDGDGDVDVYFGTQQTSPCGIPDRLLRNDGTGIFTASLATAVNDHTMQVLAFDQDGDGDQDVLQVNAHGSFFCNPWSTRLLRNVGNGTFVDATAAAMPQAPFLRRGAALLDLQPDGRLDVVFDDGSVFVNTGAQLIAAPPMPLALAKPRAGDVDGDGDTDLVGLVNDDVHVLRNDGALGFAVVATPSTLQWNELRAADVDGDGDLDLLLSTGSAFGGGTRLWRQDPGLVFTDVSATALPPLSVGWFGATFLDSDGDNDLDLQIDLVGLLHNDGAGRFVRLAPPTMPQLGRAADVDGDGHVDLVAVQTSGTAGTLAWWRNPGDGLHVPGGTILTGNLTVGDPIVPFDMDGDGDLDVFAGSAREHLARNDGGGTFTNISATALPPPVLPPASRRVAKPAAGDFDGDGDVDLFLARGLQSPPSPQDALYRNDGSGVFTDVGPSHFVDTQDTWDAVALDHDGDGDLDLAVLNGTAVRLFANDGTAHFTDVTAAHLPAALAPVQELLVVDVDGDTDPDLVLGRAGPATLLRNTAGAFVDASAQLAPHAGSDYPSAVDFDADGDLDLLLYGTWLVNDGTGTFAASATPGLASLTFRDEAAWADVDGDGDADCLGLLRNRHRHLESALPPRLGLHGELWLHAASTAPGWPVSAFLFVGAQAQAPIPLGSFGTVLLDPATAVLHSASTLPSSGPAIVRYLCPANPALVGTTMWSQALFLHGPALPEWRLGNLAALHVQL